ncbi:MAG: hypothetical protein ACK5MU_04345 [Candidatus Saccharimonadales bacterium]
MSKNIVKILAGIGVVAGLGMAVVPISSYAASQDVDVSFKINATLGGSESICTSASNVAGGGIAAGLTSEVTCVINYSANGGASVSIVDKDGTNTLVGANASNTIAAFSTTANLTGLTGGGTAGWGYKFAATTPGAGTGGLTAITNAANYNGVPTGTALTVGSNTAPVTSAVGTFTFGVQTAVTTVADTYSDVVSIAITPAV